MGALESGTGHLLTSGRTRKKYLAESTPTNARRLSAFLSVVALSWGCAWGSACGSSVSSDKDAGPSEASRARSLLDPETTLPPRAEVLSLAQSVEAAAEREGAGARASELHTIAASLHARVWRIEGREQDGKEAVDIFRAAARDPNGPGACASAIEAAKIQGELARDASATYKELYRAQRRFVAYKDPKRDAGMIPSSDPCVRGIEDALTRLTAFRPPAAVLAAIDVGLAGEGALSVASLADASSVVQESARVVGVEQWSGKESARVVVILSKPAHFRTGDEAGAGGRTARTFVELDGVELGAAPHEAIASGILTRVTTEATTTGARVSLDLDGQAFRRVFHLVEPYRIVIDVARHPPGQPQAAGRRTVTKVALDAGHGGSDPGAIGPSGVQEKDVTLAIVHKIAPVLAKEGISVLFTRDDDRFVALEERTARANASAADLFISIHCNAAENRARHGVETYVLDTTSDQIASRVAARENATSQAATAEIGSILASLRMADQATRSTRFAELLQRASMASIRGQYPQSHDGGVHTAGFYVLVGARMPSALFETSYISNVVEEQALGSEDYKQRMADGVVNAIVAYREGR